MAPFVWMTALFAALALRRPPGRSAVDRSPEVVRRRRDRGCGDQGMFLVDPGGTVAFGPSGRRAARCHGSAARRAARRRAGTVTVEGGARLTLRPLSSGEGTGLAAVYLSEPASSGPRFDEGWLLRRLAALERRQFRLLMGETGDADDATVGGSRV